MLLCVTAERKLLFIRLRPVSNNRAQEQVRHRRTRKKKYLSRAFRWFPKFCLSLCWNYVVGVKNVRVNINCLSLCDACTCARCECLRLCVFMSVRPRTCVLCRGHSKCVIGAGWAGGRNSRNKRGPVQPRDCSMNHPGTYTVAGQSSQPSAQC